jgi:hypothetical protein
MPHNEITALREAWLAAVRRTISEGDQANEFYFIREGMVAVELMVPKKRFIRV